jgi:hypothetical protein
MNGVIKDMFHRTLREIDDRPQGNHADPARATASGAESLLDHHIEELLAAFSYLPQLRLAANGDSPA